MNLASYGCSMKKSFFIGMLITMAASCFGQQGSTFPLERIIEGGISDFSVDNLGNVYLLYRDDRIKKLNPKGDSIGVFNATRRYGPLYSMDVTNPLKIILY